MRRVLDRLSEMIVALTRALDTLDGGGQPQMRRAPRGSGRERRDDAFASGMAAALQQVVTDRMASSRLRELLSESVKARPIERLHAQRSDELLATLEHSGASVPARLLAAVRLGGPAGDGVRGRLFSLYRLAGGDVRLAAAVALACRGDPRVLDALVEGLEHEHADARFAALNALGVLSAEALPAMKAINDFLGRERDRDLVRNAMDVAMRIARAVRKGPTELLAAEAPAGRGTEPEAVLAPAGRGTELIRGGEGR